MKMMFKCNVRRDYVVDARGGFQLFEISNPCLKRRGGLYGK
jgi:hypothetical protein